MEHDERIENTIREMTKQSIDCLIITRPENMYYLTNYQTVGNPTQVLLVFRNKKIHLITRELEASNAEYRTNIPYSYYFEYEDRYKKIADFIKNNSNLDSVETIGFEYNSYRICYLEQLELENHISANYDNEIKFKDCSTLVAGLRSIKSPTEISYVKRAAEFSATGLKAGIAAIKPGIMETQIAGVINNAMMSKGCEYTAYPCFVASGDRGCMGHYTPEQKKIREGELLFMEIGGCYKRYHAAKMHTIWVGSNPPAWFIEARSLIQEAIRSVMTIMKPGVLAGTLDAHMRNIIKNNTHGLIMNERSGYSIGIGFYTDWAENDIFKIYPDSKDRLYENMTCHLIPWIQIPNVGGIGFSDTVVVTKNGAESLFDGFHIPETYERTIKYINKNIMLMSSQNYDHQILEFVEEEMGKALEFHSNTEPTKLIHRNDIPGIGNLFIKDESNRMNLKAFKILGVSYAIHRLEESGKLKPGDIITTMTDGNHGAAVAFIAKQKGYKAKIFVPNNMTEERKQTILEQGAECIVCEGNYDEAIHQVRQEVEINGWTLISDTSWDGYSTIPKYITTGYCTLFHEAKLQIEEIIRNKQDNKSQGITHIFLQVGVGGFAAAGIAYSLLKLKPPPKLICVEPEDADCIFENIKNFSKDGKFMSKGKVNSIMSGLNCGQPSAIAWPLIRDYISSYIAIGDEWARKAVRNMYHNDKRVKAGESGAAGYGGLLASLQTPEIREHLQLDENSNVLVINTEGITDKEGFQKIIRKRNF